MVRWWQTGVRWAIVWVVAAVPAVASALERSVVEGPLAPRAYWLFESGPVRPLALSHDGRRLYVANIPDGRLEILAVTDLGLIPLGSVPVGLEPVAVAVSADDARVWVVNHLSDSISVVDVTAAVPDVEATLWVGDEPRDVVFAGPSFDRAYVTTAHRGQNHPLNPQLTTPGVGRADVWVFEAPAGRAPVDGQPSSILSLFGDTPRALAATPNGDRVYAAVFRSGNGTTTLPPAAIRDFPKPPPNDSADGVPEPETGIIVRREGHRWLDEAGRNYGDVVRLALPDLDLFEIDAAAAEPEAVRSVTAVGTTLFDLAVNPVSGDLYVSNIDARNHVRFAGDSARASSSVRGHLADHRVSVLHDGAVLHRDLNPQLDYSDPPADPAARAGSLSMPMGLAVSADGARLFVAAYGSATIAVYDTAALVDQGSAAAERQRLEVPGGGPAGLVMDEARGLLYVLTRFDNAVVALDPESGEAVQRIALFNPEPAGVTAGRKFLYDARLTSGFGNDSCHTCHLFGDNDALAWDLGDPDGEVRPIPNAYHPLTASHPQLGHTFHPLKGPMTTQSMRGLPRHGPQHWRGDRTGQQRVGGETLEEAAFKEFNEAFDALGGLGSELDAADMQAFTDFALQLTYPPNPIRALDNSLTEVQQRGRDLYMNGVQRADGNLEICVTCHRLDPAAGVFGTTGTMAFNDQPGEKDFKIPHFRDQYQKVGMFTTSNGPQRDQVRGFAMNHNGATSINALFAEFGVPLTQTEALKQYLFAFPAEMAPVTGQQLTVDAARLEAHEARLELLLDQAASASPVPGCDLVVRGVEDGARTAWAYDRARERFVAARGSAELDRTALNDRLRAAVAPHTLTCAPWGSGTRLGLDRDGDGVNDGDELRQGSHPADPSDNRFRAEAGLWWNPARDGQGFDLQHGGRTLALTWYTYDEDGSPAWYQATGEGGRYWQAELLRYRWDPATGSAVPEAAGRVAIEFFDAFGGRLDWTIGAHSGSQPIERFRFDARPTNLPLTGLWYDPGEPGYGLSVDSQGATRVAVVYFYGDDRQPRWVLAQGSNTATGESTAVAVRGPCPWCAFRPAEHADGGTVRLDFESLHAAAGAIDAYLAQPGRDGWRRPAVGLARLTEVLLLPQF